MARTPSLARRSSGRPPRLHRPLRRWLGRELRGLRPAVAASAAACRAERYRKHFDAFQHTCLLLFHGLSDSPSLRASYDAFELCAGLVELSGLRPADDPTAAPLTISYSQVAASNTSRPAGFLGGLVPALLARAHHVAPRSVEAMLDGVLLLDSTFLRLSFTLGPWLPVIQRPTSSGVRLQLQYEPTRDLPETVLITTVRTNDCQGLDQAILDDPARLAALAGRTLIVDLGYYSHRRFARLLAAGVHLVTRLHPQAALAVEADRPVQAPLPTLAAGRLTILADQRVTVGSANNRAGDRLRGLRLVTATVQPLPKAARRGAQPQTYRVLTDRWDLAAAEVGLLYLWRWQIELFLRWFKGHVHLPRLLGYSENAVDLSVWLAILVHLLTLLAAHALGQPRRSPTLLRQLAWSLVLLTPTDLLAPSPSLQQLPFPDDWLWPSPPPET